MVGCAAGRGAQLDDVVQVRLRSSGQIAIPRAVDFQRIATAYVACTLRVSSLDSYKLSLFSPPLSTSHPPINQQSPLTSLSTYSHAPHCEARPRNRQLHPSGLSWGRMFLSFLSPPFLTCHSPDSCCFTLSGGAENQSSHFGATRDARGATSQL